MIKLGTRLRYTGGYNPAVPSEAYYPTGVVIRREPSRGKVVVRLDTEQELYADWPDDQVEEA